jgi:transcriptional regulator of acetoin/glycerol metabolism
MTHVLKRSEQFTQMSQEREAEVHLRMDPNLLVAGLDLGTEFNKFQGIRPLCEVEREAILNAYQLMRNPCVAAKALGIGKSTMYRKMHKYGITPFSALGRL